MDIKPENILIESTNSLTLIDFGFSVQYDTTTEKNSHPPKYRGGSALYSAPEITLRELGKEEISSACDIWSVGIVFFEWVCIILVISIVILSTILTLPYYHQSSLAYKSSPLFGVQIRNCEGCSEIL